MIHFMYFLILIMIFSIPGRSIYAVQDKQIIETEKETIILEGNSIKIIGHWSEKEKEAFKKIREEQKPALEKTYNELMLTQQREQILSKIDDSFVKQTRYLRKNNCGHAIRLGAGSFNDVRPFDVSERIEFSWFQKLNFKAYDKCKKWGEFFGAISKHLPLQEIREPDVVLVEEYDRDDESTVSTHYRAKPDQFVWNNFGPSLTNEEFLKPYIRDYDRDGIPNYLDIDDDADGIIDDMDTNQYSG